MISKPLHVLSLFFCCVGIFIYTATRKLSVKSSIGIYPHGKAKNTNERDDILNSFVSTLRSHRSLDTSNHSHNNVAPWIPDHGRKVLFVELLTWEDYYNKLKKTTGEYYVSATWDYALRRNGFVVDRVSTKQYYDRMTKSELLVYHRIFVRDPRWHHYYDDKNILCRVRPMYFYGGWVFGKNDHNYRFNAPFAQTQILSANREEKNSFLGYFPHNILQPDEQRPFRKKVGFLLGKMPHYFDGHGDVIKALLDAGFELHSTCTDLSTKVCPLPQEIIRHGSMTPIAFANLMTQFSFMLGFVEPKVSIIFIPWYTCSLNNLASTQFHYLKTGIPVAFGRNFIWCHFPQPNIRAVEKGSTAQNSFSNIVPLQLYHRS